MNEIEGVGEAVTGGLLARAVESEAGEDGHTHETHCLNCGATLAGAYCHACGQRGHVHRTLGAFAHDLLHGVLHFEGKIWRTLPMLAWWPGELTRRYIEGERARFVSPIALFLFAVFLMFAAFSTLGGPLGGTGTVSATPEGHREAAARIAALDREIAAQEAERRTAAAEGRSTRALDLTIEMNRSQRRLLDSANHSANGTPDPNLKAQELSELNVDTPWPWFNRAVAHVQENPALFAYKLQNGAYKFSWALIPISVPFVWLLFLHRRRYRRYRAYDHVVFITYSIAFVTLLLIALSLLRAAGLGGYNGLVLVAALPVHMFRQLRGAYALSAGSALWRTVFLLFFALVSSLLFFAMLLTMGLLG